MFKRYGKLALLPAAAVLGVSLGALGGALAFDHFAAQYLWPEPEDVAIRPYVPRFSQPAVEPPPMNSDAS